MSLANFNTFTSVRLLPVTVVAGSDCMLTLRVGKDDSLPLMHLPYAYCAYYLVTSMQDRALLVSIQCPLCHCACVKLVRLRAWSLMCCLTCVASDVTGMPVNKVWIYCAACASPAPWMLLATNSSTPPQQIQHWLLWLMLCRVIAVLLDSKTPDVICGQACWCNPAELILANVPLQVRMRQGGVSE